jgi:glycosyltransferase involved in cell wall biosynthesis
MTPQRSIIMGCGNYWQSTSHVGDHELALQFLKAGWRVTFLSAPISPFHFGRCYHSDFRSKWSNWRTQGQRESNGNLWHYVPFCLFPPRTSLFLNSEWIFNNWHKLTIPCLTKCLIKEGFERPDLIYIRDVRYRFLLTAFERSKSLFRFADNDAGFKEYGAYPAHRQAERKLIAEVTHVGYTAASLADYVRSLSPRNARLLENGVDMKRFEKRFEIPPADLAAIPTPRAIYVGALDYWFDGQLVVHAATAFPDVSFVIVGPGERFKELWRGVKNIHAIGRRPHEEIAAYLQHCQVGLIPFDVAGFPDLVNAINPIKLYEYLACGLPVVAVSWHELRRLNAPITLATNAEEFITGIELNLLNRPDRKALIDFARIRDWGTIFNQLCTWLEIPL